MPAQARPEMRELHDVLNSSDIPRVSINRMKKFYTGMDDSSHMAFAIFGMAVSERVASGQGETALSHPPPLRQLPY
ncbi:hypothetical protein AGR6A_Lc90045 [Agrobacterium sp. NCPPB 925]|nr:hypothetical protein AGR6A_Lc90045 [Agrobacterium sp. NCPPB 925]